jgi:Xaa-Pro aminopeptidase
MITKPFFLHRIQKLHQRLELFKAEAMLVTSLPQLRYLSGFTGSNGVGIVLRSGTVLVTDYRYASQAKDQAKGWSIIVTTGDLIDEMKKRKILRTGMRVAFDENALPYSRYAKLRQNFPGVKFIPAGLVIEEIAAVKDEDEILKIRKATAISDKVFSEILSFLKPGTRESDIAAEITYRQRRYGADRDAFDTIVASGVRSALPHGLASAKLLEHGDLVTIDFGCAVDGYVSDITRTVILGKAKSEAKKIYTIVLEAQQCAIDAVRAGVKARAIDGVARTIIQKKGYGKYFRHSLGHGIGLMIHEQPRLARQSRAILEPGNVVTVEPGIYIPGFGGVRIEDDVVVTGGYCTILTTSPKELLIL